MRSTLITGTRRCLAAARRGSLIAAGAIAIGVSVTVGTATVANAERIWDLDTFDNCIAAGPGHVGPLQWKDYMQGCCARSGGDWDDANGKCVAPPAEAENVPGNSGPLGPPPKPRPAPPTSAGTA